MEAQRSSDWYRKRLGNFTGSEIWKLTVGSKKKGEIFGDTALSYIYQVAAERDMNPLILSDDTLFEEYLFQTEISSKAMRWGSEQELNARSLYEKKTKRRMVEVGSCSHPIIKNFASSPDGYFYSDEGEKGNLEIKCVNQSTYMKYRILIKDNATLLTTESKHFFQCQSHMMCTGADWCDFVVYNPFQNKPLHIVRILPDKSCFKMIEDRIKLANEMVGKILSV